MAYMPSISDTVIFLKIIDVTLLGILVIYSRLVTLSVEHLMKQPLKSSDMLALYK